MRQSAGEGRSSVIRYVLGCLLGFGAANALAGGCYGLLGAKGVPLEWLKGSPFRDYFVPSLFLLVVVGGSSLFAAIVVFSGSRIGRVSALGAGIVVVVWIFVQVSIIGLVSWMQPAIGIGGVAVVVLSWLLPRAEAGMRDPG